MTIAMPTLGDAPQQANAAGMTPEQAEEMQEQSGALKQQQDAILRGYKESLIAYENLNPEEKEIDSAVGDVLDGAVIKFGGWTPTWDDEPIPIGNRKVTAALVGMGDQMGDSARGIAQILKEQGIADFIDVENQDQNEEILRQLYGDPNYGNAAIAGAIPGALAEPIGLLLPIGKAKSLGKAMLASGVIGGMYGSTLYVDKDESRLTNAALTAALMGPLGGLLHKYFRGALGEDVTKVIDDTSDFVGPIKPTGGTRNYDVDFLTPEQVTLKGIDDVDNVAARGYTVDEMGSEVIEMTGTARQQGIAAKKAERLQARKVKALQKRLEKRAKRRTAKKSPEEVMDDMEVRASLRGRKQGKIDSEWKRILDRAIQPIYDNVKRYAPRVAAKLRDADATHHLKKQAWETRSSNFMKWMNSIKGDDARRLKMLINNNGFGKATMQAIREMGGDTAANEARQVQSVLNEILTQYKDVGYKVNPIPDYFPNSVKDLKSLVKREQSMIDKAIAKETARQGGRALTANQKAHIAERMFTFDVRYSNTSGSLKKRMKQNIADDELDFYHNPVDALHNYINTAAEDIAKRQFFKGFGHKADPKKGLDVHGADIDQSIDNLIDHIKAEVPDMEAQNVLVELLRSRFSADVHKTHRFVQGVKNASYASTLGNWWSAMTQMGDMVFAMHKYGMKATVQSLLGPRVTDKERLGITKAMQELTSTKGISNKIADFAFKWSGFSRIDSLGKNVNINASLRINKKLAQNSPEKFKAKWSNHFGNETQAVIDELNALKLQKNATLSDNVHLMLWNDLAETQPIGLSEMPKWYLDYPNGRIAYAYKTFALKQLNYMRNTIMKEGNPVKRAANLTKFGAMFVMANTGIDTFKDFMEGKELDVEDRALDNLWSLAGTSKYATDKGLAAVIQNALVPVPVTQGYRSVQAMTGKDNYEQKAITAFNQTPVVGRVNKAWEIAK